MSYLRFHSLRIQRGDKYLRTGAYSNHEQDFCMYALSDRRIVRNVDTMMPHFPPQLPRQPPGFGKMKVDFRQDSTTCKACTRHLFRSEAVRCQGTCNGEFHAGCSAEQDWTCGKCKQESSITKQDFNKLTAAIEGMQKSLIKMDEKISGLRVEVGAGKASDNTEMNMLKIKFESIHLRLDSMEEQWNREMQNLVGLMQTAVSKTMVQLQTTVSGLETKLDVLNASHTVRDKIDISGIQDTLNTAAHVIVTEMTRTLDRLLEEKAQLESKPLPEQKQQQGPSELDIKQDPQEDRMIKFQERKPQFKQEQQKTSSQQSLGNLPKEKRSLKQQEDATFPAPQRTKATRLQQLAAHFQVQ